MYYIYNMIFYINIYNPDLQKEACTIVRAAIFI